MSTYWMKTPCDGHAHLQERWLSITRKNVTETMPFVNDNEACVQFFLKLWSSDETRVALLLVDVDRHTNYVIINDESHATPFFKGSKKFECNFNSCNASLSFCSTLSIYCNVRFYFYFYFVS